MAFLIWIVEGPGCGLLTFSKNCYRCGFGIREFHVRSDRLKIMDPSILNMNNSEYVCRQTGTVGLTGYFLLSHWEDPPREQWFPFQVSNCSDLFGLISLRLSNNFHHLWPKLQIDYQCARNLGQLSKDLSPRLHITADRLSSYFRRERYGWGWGNTI